MGTKLKNRRATEQQLGSFIQNMSVSEHMVLQIMDAEVRAIKITFNWGIVRSGRGAERQGVKGRDEEPQSVGRQTGASFRRRAGAVCSASCACQSGFRAAGCLWRGKTRAAGVAAAGVAAASVAGLATGVRKFAHLALSLPQ